MKANSPKDKASKKATAVKEKEKQPWLFRLTIKINRGAQLPIADITTSDPYVIVDLGDRNIGKTQTIYRNRDPTWDANFPDIYLTHIDQSVHFRVMDDDRDKNDDPLGDITIPLRSIEIPFNTVKELVKPLCQIEGSKIIASGMIYFSILLEKNANVISLKSDGYEMIAYNPLMHPIVEEELLRVNAPEALLSVLKSWQGKYVSIDDRNYLRDLLLDVCSAADFVKISRNMKTLISTGSIKSATVVPMYVKKPIESLVPNRASIYDIKSGSSRAANPSKEIKLTLIMSNSDHHIIVFPSQYLLWIWSRAIRYAVEVLDGKVGSKLPSWLVNSNGLLSARDIVVYSHSQTANSVPYTECKGNLVLALTQSPILLTLNTENKRPTFSIDIMSIDRLAVSHDYAPPREFLAQIEVSHVTMPDEDPTGDGKKSIVYDPHYQFTGDIQSLARVQSNHDHHSSGPPVVSAGSGFCLGFLCGTVKVTTNAAHLTVATVGVVQDVVSSVSDALTDFYQVAVRGCGSNYRTADRPLGHNIEWNESVYIDMDLNPAALDIAHELSTKGSSKTEAAAGAAAVSSSDDLAGVYFFLYRKRTGVQDSCLGCKYLNMKDYLLQNRRNGMVELPLNDKILFNITVTSINLYTIEATSSPATESSARYTVSCKFVDLMGGEVKKFKQTKTILKSQVPLANTTGIQFHCQDLKFGLSDQDGLDDAAYIRFDIMIESNSLSEERIASAFIPIEAFSPNYVDISIPLSAVNGKAEQLNKCWSKGFIARGGVYGNFAATISREIAQRSSSDTRNANPHITIKFNVEEQNILSTFWPCEAVLTSDMTADKLLFAPAYDGILLLDAADPALRHGHQIRVNASGAALDEAIDFDSGSARVCESPTAHGNVEESMRQNLGDEIQVVVLENERNLLTVFKKEHLVGYDFAPFSDEHGNAVAKVSRLTEILPPYGYYWENDWSVDLHFDPNIDIDGWKYGPDFKSIAQRTKKKFIVANKAVELVRSRRWIRRAHRSHSGGRTSSDPLSRDTNQNFVYPQYSSDFTNSSPTNQSRFDWRETVLHDNPNKVLACCKERTSMSSGVRIPYDQVLSYEQVSDTILSIHVQVQRYLGKSALGEESYRPIEIEIFVEFCPALSMKLLLNERCEFYRIRKNLSDVFQDERDGMINHRMKSSHFGRQQSLMDSFSRLSYQQSPIATPRKDRLSVDDDDDNEEEDNGPPVTAEISIGCLALQEIDQIYLSLQQALKSNVSSKVSELDLRILEQRLLRVQMYYGLLLGVAGRLTDKAKYEERSIIRLVAKDLITCESIDGNDEIETSVSRMEYLFDSAESNILYYSLHGYMFHATGGLQSSLQILINEYFIALISTVGKYFESMSASQTYLKGLQRKIAILIAFMRYNDRLEMVASTALRFFHLTYEPVPRLSTVLKINVLIALYANILQEDMAKAVDSALHVWQDLEKNASGNLEFYQYNLPWIPMRSKHTTGYFYTSIPQDAVNFLLEYVSLARVDEEGIAPSFRPLLAIVESRVNLSFAWSLKYLCDLYWQTLSSSWSQWTDRSRIVVLLKETLLPSTASNGAATITYPALNAAEEFLLDENIYRFLDEKSDWMCSLANDAYRITSSSLISNPPKPKRKQSSSSDTALADLGADLDFSEIQTPQELQPRIEGLLSNTKLSFKHLISQAVDALSSATMFQLSLEYTSVFNPTDFYQEWKRRIPMHSSHDDYDTNTATGMRIFPKSTFLSDFITALVDTITKQKDCLLPACYLRYVEICIDKCIGMFYWLIYEASDANVRWIWHHPEVTQLYHDVKYLRKAFDSLGMPMTDTIGTTVDAMSGHELTDLGTTKITMIGARMVVLEHMVMFLRLKKITKRSLQAVFEPVLAIAPHRRAVIDDISELLQMAVSLRLDIDWMTAEEKHKHENQQTQVAAPRHSLFGFRRSVDIHSTPDGKGHAAAATAPHTDAHSAEKSKEKRMSGRESIFSAFGFGQRPPSGQTAAVAALAPEADASSAPLSPSTIITNTELTRLRYEIAQIDAAMAARAEHEEAKTIKLEDDESSDESVDLEIINSFISSISAWTIRKNSYKSLTSSDQDQDMTSNACLRIDEESNFSHMQYYFCAEARIRIYHLKKDYLLKTLRMKSFLQAILILPAHQTLSKEEELESIVEPQSHKTGGHHPAEKRRTSALTSSSSLEDSHEYLIEISGLYITDLFYVDATSHAVYVSFDLDVNLDETNKWKYHYKSSVMHDSTAPDWRSEPPIQIPVHVNVPVDYAKTHSSKEILRTVLTVPLICTVRYKGHLYGKVDVGVFKINIASLDINPIQGEYRLDTSASDAKIQKAATKALALPGSSPPKVGLTVRLVQRAKATEAL
jgi:hypothetical protein